MGIYWVYWVRISDKCCIQGGFCNATQYNTTTVNVTFLKPYKDTNYIAEANPNTPDHQGTWSITARCAVKTTSGMCVHGSNNANGAYTGNCSWITIGYIN